MRGFVLIELLIVMVIAALLLGAAVGMTKRHADELVWQRWFAQLDELVLRTESLVQAKASRSRALGEVFVDEYALRFLSDEVEYSEWADGEQAYREVIKEQTGTLRLLGEPIELRWRLPFEVVEPLSRELKYQREGAPVMRSYLISLP